MAEAREGQKSWIWMMVAVVLTVLLMFWLNREASQYRESVAVVEDTAVVEDEGDAPRFERASLEEIGADVAGYEGRSVRTEVEVGAELGRRGFLADTGQGTLLLVVIPTSVEDVPSFRAGETVRVSGTVRRLEEGDVEGWIGEGVLVPEARQQVAPGFITHYLEAERVRAAEEEQEEAEADTASGG